MPEVSALGPIDPSSVIAAGTDESEKKAPWIIRKLVGVSSSRVEESLELIGCVSMGTNSQ